MHVIARFAKRNRAAHLAWQLFLIATPSVGVALTPPTSFDLGAAGNFAAISAQLAGHDSTISGLQKTTTIRS